MLHNNMIQLEIFKIAKRYLGIPREVAIQTYYNVWIISTSFLNSRDIITTVSLVGEEAAPAQVLPVHQPVWSQIPPYSGHAGRRAEQAVPA